MKEDAAILSSHHFFGFLLIVLFVFSRHFSSEFNEVLVLDLLLLLFELLGVNGTHVDLADLEHLVNVRLKRPLHILLLLSHRAVPVVLDRVVGTALQDFGNLGPLVVKFAMEQIENPLFYFGPFATLVSWIQVIVPPLSAVLALPVWEVVGDQSPLLWTDFLDEANKGGIFLGCPHGLLATGEPSIRAFGVVVLLVVIVILGHGLDLLVVDMWVEDANIVDAATHANGVVVALSGEGLLHALVLYNWLLD